MRRCIFSTLEIHAQKNGCKSCGGEYGGRLTATGRETRGNDSEEPSVRLSFFMRR